MTTPAKPVRFHPEDPPPSFEKKLVTFWQSRRIIVPRLQLVHTNAASGQGNIESSYSWAMRNTWPDHIHGNPPGSKYTTIPTCQIDRDGRGALMLPSNRQSITNARANSFSLGFETADRGYNNDPYPAGSTFTDAQAESVAVCFAYYAWGHGIPLVYPDTWDGTGTACHTEPFGYPNWTNSQGKACPGDRKKQQVRNDILPRAREILDAWVNPPGDDDVTDEDIARIAAATAAAVELDDADIARIADAVLAKMPVDEIADAAALKVWRTQIADGPTGIKQNTASMLGWTRRDAAHILDIVDDAISGAA